MPAAVTLPPSGRVSNIRPSFANALRKIGRGHALLAGDILPPVAVLLCGKPFLAILNFILTSLPLGTGRYSCVFVVNSHLADVRVKELARAIGSRNFRGTGF